MSGGEAEASGPHGGCSLPFSASLRANGSRECAPDDRFRETIHSAACGDMDCFVSSLLAMTDGQSFAFSRRRKRPSCGREIAGVVAQKLRIPSARTSLQATWVRGSSIEIIRENNEIGLAFDVIKDGRTSATLAGISIYLFLICSISSGTVPQFVFRSFR